MMTPSMHQRRARWQHTLASTVRCTGTALHSGQAVTMTLKPAPGGSGIVFRRTDKPGSEPIPALWHRVAPSPLCTTLTGDDGTSVGTIEHLMAAFAASGIDNALVEIDGSELPILDGSAAPFLSLIERAGRAFQLTPRKVIRVLKAVQYTDDVHGKAAMLLPSDSFQITCHIDFASKAIGRQKHHLNVSEQNFTNHIARARTFGFMADVEKLKAAGLARGGSLENALVIDGDTILNPEGTRYADECVRHKVLDAVGDLYLAGAPLLAHYHAEKPGHFVNYKILEALFADPDAYSIDEQVSAPARYAASENVAALSG